MGLLNVSASQTIEAKNDLNTTANLFQKALQQIGTHKDTQFISSDKILMKGKSRYGLQGIPLEIEFEKIDDTNTKVVVGGKSDDVGGVGAKKCIERLMNAYQTFASADKGEIQYLETTPSFEKKTGFTKKKLFLYVVGFIVLLVVIINANKGSGDSFSGGPHQSPFDNSVDCVESYIKHNYLRDPDSYESIKWTKVIKKDDGTYQVTHSFRAKNGFGGMGVETKTFTIASDGSTVTNAY